MHWTVSPFRSRKSSFGRSLARRDAAACQGSWIGCAGSYERSLTCRDQVAREPIGPGVAATRSSIGFAGGGRDAPQGRPWRTPQSVKLLRVPLKYQVNQWISRPRLRREAERFVAKSFVRSFHRTAKNPRRGLGRSGDWGRQELSVLPPNRRRDRRRRRVCRHPPLCQRISVEALRRRERLRPRLAAESLDGRKQLANWNARRHRRRWIRRRVGALRTSHGRVRILRALSQSPPRVRRRSRKVGYAVVAGHTRRPR